MGQHKYNPTAQLAKEGKLPPKKSRIGKPEKRRLLQAIARKVLFDKTKIDIERGLFNEN